MYLNTQLRMEGGAFEPIIVCKDGENVYWFYDDDETDSDADDDTDTDADDDDDIDADLDVEFVALEDVIGLLAAPVNHRPEGHSIVSSAVYSVV